MTNMEWFLVQDRIFLFQISHVQYCFCYYVIKSAGEVANKVLLSVIWNPLLIEINFSQIRTLDIKCAVWSYLLFSLIFLKGSGKPYHVSIKIVFMYCTFSQELFIVGSWTFYRLFMKLDYMGILIHGFNKWIWSFCMMS